MSEEEQKTIEENKKETKVEGEATPTKADGNEAPLSPIEKAEQIVKSIDEKTANFETMISRMEKVAARMLVSGRAAAGEPMKTEEEQKTDEVDKKVADSIQELGL